MYNPDLHFKEVERLQGIAASILEHGASQYVGRTLSKDEECDFMREAQACADGVPEGLQALLDIEDAWEAYSEYAFNTQFHASPIDFQEWVS